MPLARRRADMGSASAMLAHHQHGQAVHVEGERGRGVALGDLLGHQAVGLEARAQATVALRNAEGEQPCRAQVVVVVERKRRLAVVPLRARREALDGERRGPGR